MIKLKFVIDQDYLITHTLASMSTDRFSSAKHKRDIVAFQNYAWKLSKDSYNYLIGRIQNTPGVNIKLPSERQIKVFLSALKKSHPFQKILRQTENDRKSCEQQWGHNAEATGEIMRGITGLRFNKSFRVFITHPSLKNGRYIASNKISWGHYENWPNYTIVYLWHEILHSYLGRSDVDHAIIQLATDQELRVRLNGGKYPPYVGHKELFPIMNKLLPNWRRYLAGKRRNILSFSKTAKKIIG